MENKFGDWVFTFGIDNYFFSDVYVVIKDTTREHATDMMLNTFGTNWQSCFPVGEFIGTNFHRKLRPLFEHMLLKGGQE